MKATILHRKKALFPILFTLLLCVTGMTKTLAQEFTVDNLNYSINDDEMSVTVISHVDGSNASGGLVIPENVSYAGNTYVVTAIGDYAFYEHIGLTGSLGVPNSVTEIGYAAFSGCSGFNGILTLGNSLTVIGSHAFEGCSGFTGDLVIPNSVSILGGHYTDWGWDLSDSYAFSGCSGFNGTLTLSNSLSMIGCGCFMGCSGFTGDLVIPNSVIQLGCSWGNCDEGAFEGCSGFTGDLTILGETEIGPNSFSGCSGFSGALTLGAFITGIYDNAFYGCEGFSSITALGTGGWLEGDWESVFAGVSMEIPVFVACDNLDNFQQNPVWSSFSNLQEMNPCLWEVLATADPPESGTVSGSGLYPYEEDDNGNFIINIDLCATPNEGYTFYYWTDDFELNEWDSLSSCNNGSIGADYTYHRHYVAHFRPTSSEITVTANPVEGGTVSGGGVYGFGAECTLTATANEGYLFVDWTENGRHVSYDTNYSFIVTEDRNLVANFREGYGCAVIFDFYDTYGDGWNGNKLVVTDDLGYSYQLTLAEGFSGTQILMLVSGSHITLTWIKNYWSFECSFTVSYSNGEVICQASEPNNSFFYEFDVNCGDMPIPSFDVTATANPVVGGTISGAGEYDFGATCTLTATASEGYTFVHWTENGYFVSSNPEYTFNVTCARNLVAHFVKGIMTGDGGTATSNFLPSYNYYKYTLSQQIYTTEELGGVGLFTRIAFYNAGAEKTRNYNIYMKVTEKSAFSNVSDWEVVTEADKVFSGEVTMISGDWTFITFTNPFIYDGISNVVLVTDDNTGGYYNSSNMACRVFGTNSTQAIYKCNDNTNFNPYDPSGYNGTLLSVKNQIILGVGNVSVASAISAIANPIEGGTISGNGTYYNGSVCTLTATANPGYTFIKWTQNGTQVSTNPSYSFTVAGNAAYVAHFEQQSFNITASASPNDGGMVTGGGTYNYGQTCTLSATESEGYTFINWTKDNVEVSTESTYSFTVTEDAAYVANFLGQSISYEIIATANPMEGGTVTGAGTYTEGATCTLTATANPGYTFVNWTKDNVEVSTEATYSFTVTEDATYEANFILGQGEVTQETSLAQGWNWWSTYVEQAGMDGLGMLEESLGDNGVTIRSQVGYTDYYAGYGWYGSLASINNESSYKIKANASCVATMAGSTAVSSQHPITLNQGWTWMGYVPSAAMDVNEALSGLESSVGDKLKSQQGYADYYANYGWYGSLNTIEPGMGLMYYSSNGETVTFTYPDGSKDEAKKSNLTAESNHWKPNTYAYPDNMTVMAVLELDEKILTSENYELAAFAANGECRGSISLVYAEPLHRHVAFLTVSGSEATELSFRLYDTETGTEYCEAEESLDFVANAIVGDANDLYVIHFRGAMGMDELANRVKVYPNPVNAGERFSIGMANAEVYPVHVEIVNALGVEMLRSTSVQTPASIMAPATAGVYTLHITVEGKGTVVKKLVVK